MCAYKSHINALFLKPYEYHQTVFVAFYVKHVSFHILMTYFVCRRKVCSYVGKTMPFCLIYNRIHVFNASSASACPSST